MTDEQLLYGTGEEDYITGLHRHGEQEVKVYTRPGGAEDQARGRRERVHPFLFLKPGEKFEPGTLGASQVRKLRGNRPHSHLLVFDSMGGWRKARKAVRYESDTEASVAGPTTAEEMYLMQTGKTLFGGFFGLSGVRRMQADIEVLSRSGDFPQADAPRDKVCMIALKGNWEPEAEWRRGPNGKYEVLLELGQRPGVGLMEESADDPGARPMDERRVLIEFIREVQRMDPDVIEGHNFYDFDLRYLLDRADHHGVNLGLGRGGTTKGGRERDVSFADHRFTFPDYNVPGRAVVDTMFLAAQYDVFARDLRNLKLKSVAKHFGVAPDERTYLEGGGLDQMWDQQRGRLRAYAMDDVRETEGVAASLLPSQFFLTRALPMGLGRCHVAGTASRLESLLVRGYLHARHSLPEPDAGVQKVGGLTELMRRGLHKRCAYADVSSLYPSIMLKYGYLPRCDDLGFMRRILEGLTELRLEKKAKARDPQTGETLAQLLSAEEQSYKILINSAYGMQGHAQSVFNDIGQADNVTVKGQELLRRMMGLIADEGGVPILADTDGCMFTLAGGSRQALIERVDAQMPSGIEIDNDGHFQAVLAYKKKNYAKLPQGSDELSITGGSLKARNIEKFGQEYIGDQLRSIVAEDFAEVRERHIEYIRALVRQAVPVGKLAKRSNIKHALDADEEEVQTNPNRHRMGQYEVAKRLASEGRPVGVGSTVEWYVAYRREDGSVWNKYAKVAGHARHVSKYNGDEATTYYLGRLKSCAERFRPLFGRFDFRTLFPDPTDQEELSQAGSLFEPAIDRVEVKETVVKPLEEILAGEDEVPF